MLQSLRRSRCSSQHRPGTSRATPARRTTVFHPRRRRMDPLEERIEVEAPPTGVRNDDLAVDDAAFGERRTQRIEQLGEVAAEWAQLAALQFESVAVAEDQTPESIPLRLEQPAVAVGDRFQFGKKPRELFYMVFLEHEESVDVFLKLSVMRIRIEKISQSG